MKEHKKHFVSFLPEEDYLSYIEKIIRDLWDKT